MKIKLTIDVFSGRPNPTLTLDGRDAKKILDQVSLKSGFKKNSDKTAPEPFGLGYRGVIIEQLDAAASDMPKIMRVTPDRAYGDNSSATATDNEFEKIIFDLITQFKDTGSKKEFRTLLEDQVKTFRAERKDLLLKWPIDIIKWPVLNPCSCAPDADIAWWNDGGQRQFNNNCYNYASNYRTDTFAQPGKAAGLQYTSLSGCAVAAGQRSAKDGAVADCLIDTPAANNVCPGKGHLVALVVAPGYDFHWYRKGPDGKWSHKPGGTQATLVDNSGNPIADPRTANRGPYTQFCTFMQVLHGHIKIK
ncbi:hypothetical protein [Ferruginibacter sp. SUN106]|uniref:hypothetical protein n=1 Tax=Ferruginibacter sp. SUN106 TaxID=2978348 RepID=UPI003D36DFEA